MDGRSLGGLLSAVRSEIPTALLSGSGLEHLLSCAASFPFAAAIYPFGLELRLDNAEPAADFAIGILPGSSVVTHVRRLAEETGAKDPQAAALAWMLGELERRDSFLARFIGCPILEYDLIDSGPDHPPGLFLPAADEKGYCNPGLMTAAVTAAAGLEEDAGERRAIERIFAALPSGARIIHAGLFPGRRPRCLRLVIKSANADTALAFLEGLGWPGPLAEAAHLLAVSESLTPSLCIDLDIEAGDVRSSLGVELWLKAGREVETIEWLEAEGLCLSAKADGLRAFPGRSRVFDLQTLLQVERWIGHVKVTPNSPHRRAKAYLCLHAKTDIAG